MSARDSLPESHAHDPFGRSPPAASVEALRAEVRREQRVAEIMKSAQMLVDQDDPAYRAVGERLIGWLQHGGSLERRLGVAGRRGSHRTARAIAGKLAKD